MEQVRRRETIRRIVQERPVQNQESLQAELARLGIEATQGTISRDLRAIGAVKGPGGYMVPGGVDLAEPDRSATAMRQHVMSIDEGVGLVMLRTHPGSAQVVALELDRRRPPHVVGTVAGDDTVLVAVASAAKVHPVARSLREQAGLAGSGGVDQ